MAVTSIELQVISKILTSRDPAEVAELCEYDESYYSVFKPHIQFIFNHLNKYDNVPDLFTFQSEFPDITLVDVRENVEYLGQEMSRNKQHIILVDTFNTLKDLGSGDIEDAWKYLTSQCNKVAELDTTQPLDLIKQAKERSQEIVKYSQQARIPTGFPEIDRTMYGGLSTVEELAIIVARTNNGKSWVGVKMMESAQQNGFPVLYYSPEMQSSFLGTRFDTWRGHFENSKLYQGNYDEAYMNYLKELVKEDTSAYILEDKDVSEGVVNVDVLRNLVRKLGIKLLVVDGLSYMEDSRGAKGEPDHLKYKNLCNDLFRLSKQFHCAVVVMMQANRESRDNKDDKGEVFPNIYNIEGSDHPGRIATQVFSMRQIFDKHVLDIRLEKARNANNQKPEFSYSWDINTGNMQYLPDSQSSDAFGQAITPVVPGGIPSQLPDESVINSTDIVLEDDEDDVEF